MELVFLEVTFVLFWILIAFATAHWVFEQSKLCADPMLLDVPDRPNWRRMTYQSEDLVDELKFYSDYRNATNLTAFVSLDNMLPEIQRGTAENQRIGNKISIPWISLSYVINTRDQAIAAPSDGLVRMIIVADHQSNGTTPLFSQIVDTTIGYLSGPYNRDNVPQRFQILHDEILHVKTGAVTYNPTTLVYSNGLGYKAGEVVLCGGPIDVHFNDDGGAATASDVISGNIFSMFLSETANVRVALNHRVHYSDY